MAGRNRRRSARRRRRAAAVALVTTVAEAGMLWMRGHRLAGNVVVRCRRGHLYTTIWIPGASVKSLRLGWWRLQRCPVGHHWSVVTPVRTSDLTQEERRSASEARDIRVP